MPPVHDNVRTGDWIDFPGAIDENISTQLDAVVIPADDPAKRWHFLPPDVAVTPVGSTHRQVWVRRGAVVQDITIQPGMQPITMPGPATSAQMSSSCDSAGSMCSNHREVCCSTRQLVGYCDGAWSCRNAKVPSPLP